jgi:hypothetical protein
MTAEQNIAQLALTTMTRLSWAQVPNLTPQPRATVLQVVASANKQQVCFVLIFRVSVFAFVVDFFFFFFFAVVASTASTSNALPTIASLNAEKAKLEAEREKLEDELEAGVSDVAERVAIRQQIAGIYTRMTAVQANITAIRTQITASINAPSKPSLSMDDVTKWLDANPLAVEQPAPPTSALWWKLGKKTLNASVGEWSARQKLNILIGVSGSGKTRSLYEMLALNFGFYWTCCRAGNGGASIVVRRIGHLLIPSLGEEHRNAVGEVVALLVCAYSILLLQWRRKCPDGTALDWLVFQTTANVVDKPMEAILVFLASHSNVAALVGTLVLAAKTCVGGDLLLVVDEAQVLAHHGRFALNNKSESTTRPLLSPFARFCLSYSFRSVWFAGTSLSLRVAKEVGLAMDAKRVPQCIVHLEMAFEQEAPFRQYLTDMVGVQFSEALCAELHALFRGRARRVAVLAECLVAGQVSVAEDEAELHERVMDVALQCESDLLSPTSTLSIVTGFVARHEENRAMRGERLGEWVKIATHALSAPCTIAENAAEWFDAGVGKLAVNGIGGLSDRAVIVFEPLTAKMLVCAALFSDDSRGFNPVLRPLLEMAAVNNESARGFLAEVFVIPVINRYIARKLGFAVPVVDFFATPHANLISSVGTQRVFVPEAAAGPDAVHTFFDGSVAKSGALGQVKFRASMNETEWAHALRTVDPAQLYGEKVGREPSTDRGREAKATRQANLAKKRTDANEAMKELWPNGSCSNIFTICEPPASVRMECEQVVDGRKLFVFSPETCKHLFDEDVHGVDVWSHLKNIKKVDE